MTKEVKPNLIKSKTKAVLADRKNVNNIADLISYMKGAKPNILHLCISSLQEIFEAFLVKQEMTVQVSSQFPDKQTYTLWLIEKYKKFCLILAELLEHEDRTVANMSLLTLSNFLKLDREYFSSDAPCETVWPNVVQKLLVHSSSIQLMLPPVSFIFEQYANRHIFLTSILSAINAKTQQTSDNFLNNAFCCLEILSEEIKKVLASEEDQLSQGTRKERKLLSKCWFEFLKNELPLNLYKRVLVILPDKVIPCLTNPLRLSDFLTNSYSRGGVISLLALSGIFILIDKHNLNYPEFYPKLYSLLNPSIFHTKYKARFFYNLDMFLSSTHLPAYMTAAFIKKLARISLHAPPHGLVCSVPLMYNLINRHKACRVLIDRTEQQFPSDPYDPNEKDLNKCNAIESSLWELKTLQQHYSPAVAKKCHRVDHLKTSQISIADLLETSSNDIFQRELEYGQKLKDTPINLFRPPGILNNQDNKMAFWCME